MLNLTIAPGIPVSSSQASDKILAVEANNESSTKNTDFSKKLAKAMNSHSIDTRKKASSLKLNKNLAIENKSENPVQGLEPGVKEKQPLKSQSLKSTNSSDNQKSTDNTQKSVASDDTQGGKADSDEKKATAKNKQTNNDGSTTGVATLAADPGPSSAVQTQDVQDIDGDHSSIDANVALDKVTPSISNGSTDLSGISNNEQNKGIGDANDPIHDLTSGVTFLQQLTNNDDAKILASAPLSNPPELSILQNSVFQNGGVLSNNSSTQQTAGTTAAVPNQNLQSQQVAIIGNQLISPIQDQSTSDGQEKTKNLNGIKVTGDSNDKSVEIPTTAGVLKAAEGASPINQASKDGNGVMPQNQGTPDSAVTDKGQGLNDTLIGNQISAKSNKGQSLNLPLIQTQLSVNNQNDKMRTDAVIAVPSPKSPATEISVKDGAKVGTNESVNKDDLFAQIVEKAKVSLNHGNGQMELNLKPEHLGKLHLKISVENQLITAKFEAESQQVKEIIETNLNELRRNLQDNGIQVDQLMVSVVQHNNNGGFENASHNSGGFAGQHNNMTTGNQEPLKSDDNPVQPRRFKGETAIDLIA